MSILILTEGGRKYGFGHITRCMAIYQAIEEIANSPEFIVNGDETIHDMLKNKNYRIFDWLNSQQQFLEGLKKTDTVFIDSYLAEPGLYEEISDRVKISVYLDDDIRIDYPKGFVINGGMQAEQMAYPEKGDVTYLLGTQYAPLRKEFWDVSAKPIRNNLETVMITFGGADIHNLTPRILKLLANSYPGLFKNVVIGNGFQNIEEIKQLKDDYTKLVYNPSGDEMKKIMLESDIAITAGGQTLYELARVGTPAIGICVAENQLRNIKKWSNLSFLEYIGWYDYWNIEHELISAIKHMENKQLRMNMSATGRKIIDGRGCKRILNAIELNKRVNGERAN